MPELPDIVIYLDALERRILGHRLDRARIANPFLLRTIAPPIQAVEGARVSRLRRLGKRIVITFDNNLSLVLHLMIAGRLQWAPETGAPIKKKLGLAAFDFDSGTLLLTEAGSTRRASLHVVDEAGVAAIDRGGMEVIGSSVEAFGGALTRENHTVKRALTDPTLFSGIGNAYSDEILHRARLSPLKLTAKMTAEEIARLHAATQETLTLWVDRLRAQTGDGFPVKVTAFRPDMAVHGRFGLPCPDCGAPVQRIAYADNECNYCARCQNGGRLLADRGMSRLLGADRPKRLEEIE